MLTLLTLNTNVCTVNIILKKNEKNSINHDFHVDIRCFSKKY